MFDDFKFDNGTGVRCWVNTFAERSPTAHMLHKIDIPIFPDKGIENFSFHFQFYTIAMLINDLL